MPHNTDRRRQQTTLLLSNMALPAAPRLAAAARRKGWEIRSLETAAKDPHLTSKIAFYGSTLEAMDVARRYDFALLEPPLDLLARLPAPLLLRHVGYGRWSEVAMASGALFLKPADPLNKAFDAGVYHGRGQIRTRVPVPPDMPVLWAEPVEWLAEYRCFVLEGNVVATSPYLSFGRPLRYEGTHSTAPSPVLHVCRRLVSHSSPALPPAFVVDVGLIEDRGWAVVEFNPAWCSGLLSADGDAVLNVLQRSCIRRCDLTPKDRRWVIR